jgi:hypothetical protein
MVFVAMLLPEPQVTLMLAFLEAVAVFAETVTVKDPFPEPLEGEIAHQPLSLEAVQA